MLKIRDDDVLVRSSSWGSPFDRFREIHDWIADVAGKVVHVPTILVSEIQEFPDCIAYIKEHTARGTMEPQLHGLEHIDYARLGLPKDRLPPRGKVNHAAFCEDEIKEHTRVVDEHLTTSVKWMEDHLARPTRWYTPWGADNDYLQRCAGNAELQLVGTGNLFEISTACDMLRQGASFSDLEKRGEIFIHWWQRGTRVKRLCAAVRHGSWAEALKREPATFEE